MRIGSSPTIDVLLSSPNQLPTACRTTPLHGGHQLGYARSKVVLDSLHLRERPFIAQQSTSWRAAHATLPACHLEMTKILVTCQQIFHCTFGSLGVTWTKRLQATCPPDSACACPFPPCPLKAGAGLKLHACTVVCVITWKTASARQG